MASSVSLKDDVAYTLSILASSLVLMERNDIDGEYIETQLVAR